MLSVLAHYIRISFASAAAYRADFFLALLVNTINILTAPLLTILIYANGAEIPGWSLAEAMLIQSVFMLCTGLCGPFFNNVVWVTMEHIREGTYDLLMLKPRSTVFITVAASFSLEHVGALVGGAVVFAYTMAKLPAPTLSATLQFVFLFAMGICMYLGSMLLMAAVSFRWIGNSRIPSIFSSISMFGRYPDSIFSRAVRVAIAWAMPVAMLGYFPAAAILGRATWAMFASALACAAFLALGWGVFRRMIYLYQSAGG
jgi:ABC-2 type transport system permease protein